MRILGAILAGGRSSRFGSDKALFVYRGRPLIGHVADALAQQCRAVVVCGREWGGLQALGDRPGPGMGPMGGLCAALHYGAQNGFETVLAAPCDLLGIPADAAARLGPGPAVADGQWLMGLWPCAGAARLQRLLESEGAISARRWISESGAETRPIMLGKNVNTPHDVNDLA